MEAKTIVERFIEKYNGCQRNEYRISRWPDEENRNARDIDAVAESGAEPLLAIEHTKVETFFNQIQDAARFAKYYGELETELKHAFDFDLMLTLPIFAFVTGTKWGNVRDTIRDWLVRYAADFDDGYSSHQINGVPFTVGISKNITGSKLFTVARRAPSDRDVHIELAQSFAESLSDKNDQLTQYRASGANTILILESPDIALVSHISLYKAFLQAQAIIPTPNIDEFWLACTYDPEDHCDLFCLLGPEVIMNAANPENFEWGPHHSEVWDQAIKDDLARFGPIDLAEYIRLARR
jgi:hypothetical protein